MIEDIAEKFFLKDSRIDWAREYNNKCMLHVHGVGLEDALERINNYENEGQKEARDRFATSNKAITDRLLRPTDNVFSAKGGYKEFIFEGDNKDNKRTLKNKLADVYAGQTLTQYIHRVWFDKYVVDPNGLILVEVSEDGSDAYPTYKSIHSIRNYEQKGMRVEWVVFEPHSETYSEVEGKKEEVETQEFWAVDEEAYYKCESDGEDVKIVDTIPHGFGEVPARLCSDIEDNVTGWKKSPIDPQIELLNKYMVGTSVLNIVEFFHSYPQQWTFVDDCARCNGTGEVTGVSGRDGIIDTTCPTCTGTGKDARKDVTDIRELKIPKEGEARIDPPSGYVYMPPESLKLMTDSSDRTWAMIMFSHWGTSLEYGGTDGNQYSSATGRWIDTQPVNNKLNRYTESVQMIHNSLANLFGRFYFPETFVASDVVYGRRYMIETPDQLKKSYTETVNLTDNFVMQDIIFEQYLESEFRDNDQMFEYHRKLTALDPYPHMKISDLADFASDIGIKMKMYVIDFKNSVDVLHVIKTPIKDLITEYKQFIKENHE